LAAPLAERLYGRRHSVPCSNEMGGTSTFLMIPGGNGAGPDFREAVK
jgi:hypothetical protein